VRPVCALAVAIVLGGGDAAAQNRVALEAFGGTALNVPTGLTLRQDGYPDLDFTARYDTRPFEVPVYWSYRLSLLDEERAFELQLTHHKLHLTDNPPEVEQFEITHGFNIATFSYAFLTLPVDLRVGGGVVLPHPEGIVRGERFDSPPGGIFGLGYHKLGPVLTGGVGKRWEPVRHLLLTTEASATAVWARGLPVSGGSVDAFNLALHLRAGLGFVL